MSENQINAAICDAERDQYELRPAAKYFNVPLTSLHSRNKAREFYNS